MQWNDLIGANIGTYQIVEELGRGGSARVFRAAQTSQHRFVAIKVMVNDADDPLGFVRRFEREVEMVAQLNHPNIVAVFDSGQHQDLLYLVMQCVTGGTLRQHFGRPLLVNEACAAMIQMGHALHHAHLHGIVHRDVKPSNMLVDVETGGQILLTDFGIAKLRGLRGLTKSGTTIGTPEYMAPEQAEGREVDPRADVYSLGCVLYEALAGRPPFIGPTPVSVMYQQVHSRPDYLRGLNPEVPRDLARLVEIALAKRPEDRFVSAESFARALQPFAERIVQPATRSSAAAWSAPNPVPSPSRPPADPPDLAPPASVAAHMLAKRAYPPDTAAASGQHNGAETAAGWGSAGLDDLFPPDVPPEYATEHDAGQTPHAGTSDQDLLDPSRSSAPHPRPSALSGPVSGPRPTVPLPAIRTPRGTPSAPFAGPVTGPFDGPTIPALAQRPSAYTEVSETHSDVPLVDDQASGPLGVPKGDHSRAGAVPPRPGRRTRGSPRAGGHSRSPRLPLIAAVALVVLTLGTLAGALVRADALAWLPHSVAAITPTAITATATASPIPTVTPQPAVTATPNQQQLLDQQAVAAFRAITLASFTDRACSSANSLSSFASSQSVYVNLCLAPSAADGHITVLLRQARATRFVITRDAQVSAGNWYAFYTYNVSPGPYDILVTYNGGTAADLNLMVH
jgi:serine/threonine-protein kinase